MSCFCIRLQKDVVKTLDFRHCSLAFIPDEVYEYEETLEELYLDSNNIKDLPRSLFHCEFLRKLSVCDNDLCSVPNAVATLVNLEQLDISKNGIVELPDSIRCCKNLSLVEISVNPLGKLPEGFTQLVNLTQLYLNDTLLNYLPANFGRLVKLTVLELRENRLKALPKSMARLTELERLDLGMNEFRQLPEVIGFYTKLTELWVDSNKLTAIPSAIGNLRDLVYLDASCNRIESLPVEIEGLDSLTDLHLSKNYLQVLPKSIGQLSTLQHLKLDSNQISYLPYSIGGLVSLEELILTYNDLEELPPSIGLLRKLTHLNVDQNMLLELPSELGSCSAISLLSLHSNLLVTLPDEIGHISSLSVVNLCNNQLRYLPYQFTKLKKLQALWLSENQSKPLIPLQSEMREDLGKRVLTCFLFPQQHREPDEDNYQSDGESFHASLWEEQRLSRRQIAFDVAESDTEHKLKRVPTPYPKEGIKRKILSTTRVSSSKSSRSRSQRSNVLPSYPSVDTTSRHGHPGSPRDGKARRPRSPGSPISDSLHLFQADKEKMAKDKARLRGSSPSASRQESDTESVASSTRERVVGRREMRARMDRAAMSDTEAFIQSPVWSHTGGMDTNKQHAGRNQNAKSPQSSGRSHSRGYESDQVGGSWTPVRSPKQPQMQVQRAKGPWGAGVGYSRGYESDQVNSPQTQLDGFARGRAPNNLEVNRNCNAANAGVDGRQSWRLSNQRSSGYSTDPERGYAVPPKNDRESRMADVKQKRDEMLPPPYYRVRQLRASAQLKANRNTPRKHPQRGPLQFKDYGWIDGQLPSTPEGHTASVAPQATQEVTPTPQEAGSRNQLMASNPQTPIPSLGMSSHSKAMPVRSRGDPTAYSDTELGSGRRRDRAKNIAPIRREAFDTRDRPNADRTFHSNQRRVSPVSDRTQEGQCVDSGYQSRQARTFHDTREEVAPAIDETQLIENIDGDNRPRQDRLIHDSRQRNSPVPDQENRNARPSNIQQHGPDHMQPPRRPADFTFTDDTRQPSRYPQKLTDPENRPPPERKNWQTLVTEDSNQDYLNSLADRRHSETLPGELSRNLTSRGSHSLPRDVRYEWHPKDASGPDGDSWQKSSSLPRSEVIGQMGEGESTRSTTGGEAANDHHTKGRRIDRKKRLHGGAPDYSASEPELRQPFQSQHSTRARTDQGTNGPPVESRGGRAEQRSSQGPVFQNVERERMREAGRFIRGLATSTPSIGGGLRAQNQGGSRPRSPGDDAQRRNRPGSPTDLPQSKQLHQHSDSESYNPTSQRRKSGDANLYRPNRLPLKPNERQYDSDYAPERPNYGRRSPDASGMQQHQRLPKTTQSSRYPVLDHGGWRDSVRGSLLTPIACDTQHQDRRRFVSPELDPQSLPHPQGPTGQPSGVSAPDLWPQDSSGYASDQNEPGWKRGSCSTPTSSVFQGPSSPPSWRPGSDVTPPNHRSRHPSSEFHDKPLPTRRVPVVIYKNPGLGFSITGGKDAPGNPFQPFDWGIFVTKIQPGGPADGVLKPGDKLLEVNGRSYESILHDEAVKLLRKSNPVSMVVQRFSDDK